MPPKIFKVGCDPEKVESWIEVVKLRPLSVQCNSWPAKSLITVSVEEPVKYITDPRTVKL